MVSAGEVRKELGCELNELLAAALSEVGAPRQLDPGSLAVKLHEERYSSDEVSLVVAASDPAVRDVVRPFGDKLKVELAAGIITWLSERNYRHLVDELRLRVNLFFGPNNGIVVRIHDGHVDDKWGCHSQMPSNIAP